jgi:hypothetical protein
MIKELLREYVFQVITERIRTAKVGKETFNLEKFKKIQDYREMVFYATDFLQYLGEGSSRIAFVYKSTQVIKIAKNEKGIAQNATEVEISQDEGTKNVVAKIFYADPQNRFVISELVRPLKSGEDIRRLEQQAGVTFGDFVRTIRSVENSPDKIDDIKNPWIKSVAWIVISHDLISSDALAEEHWGVTPEGRIVLLDYGFTENVFQKHYK